MVVPWHYLAWDERRLEATERIDPRLGIWPADLVSIGMEGMLEKLRDRRTRRVHRWSVGRWCHPRPAGVAAVGKAALGNRPLDWHVALVEIAAGKGMPAHEQQVKNQDGKAEGIMVGRARRGAERRPEQLGRHE